MASLTNSWKKQAVRFIAQLRRGRWDGQKKPLWNDFFAADSQNVSPDFRIDRSIPANQQRDPLVNSEDAAKADEVLLRIREGKEEVLSTGEVLREDFLKPLGLSANALAKALHVPPARINDIVRERRGVTPDTALRLMRYFGGDAHSWLNLQAEYDLRQTEIAAGEKIRTEISERAA